MFFKAQRENKKLKEKLTSKMLENTRIIRLNDIYKYKLNKIIMLIEQFDYKTENAFTLLNEIKKEAEYQE